MSNLFLVLVLLCGIVSISAEETTPRVLESQSKRSTVELYRCKNSKLTTNLIQNVPSYPFYQMIDVSIRKEPFPGCKSGKPPTVLNLTSIAEKDKDLASHFLETPWQEWIKAKSEVRKTIVDIEKTGASISPQGFLSIKDHNYDLDEFCVENYSEVQFNGTVYSHSLLEISYCPYDCNSSSCIPKCCPLGQSVLKIGKSITCDASGKKLWKGFIYDKYGKSLVNQEEEKRHYHYFRQTLDCDKKPSGAGENETLEFWYSTTLQVGNSSIKKTSFRLSEDGKLLFLGASRKFEELKEKIQFCIDGFQTESQAYAGTEDYQMAIVCSGIEELCYETDDHWKKHVISTVYMVCLFTAAFFYLATTAVYLLLWDSQKVQGWTIVSLMISLFFMCASTAMAHMLGLFGSGNLRNSIGCKANAIIAHYFYISSFTWLSIVNFDIWSKFRSLQVSNQKTLSKLFWYSVVGWGIPFVFICISITLNELYPDRESMILIPEYGDTLCFVASWAQGPYIYYPLIVPMGIILVLTASTFWNLFGSQKDTQFARSSSTKSDRKLATLYLKLSLILGTSWTFEVISWVSSSENCQHWIWMVADLYNALSAILIFIFFGCKKSNLTSLEAKYSIFKKLGVCRSCRKSQTQGGSSSGSGTKSTGTSFKENIGLQVPWSEGNGTGGVILQRVSVQGVENQGYDSSKLLNK